MPWWAGVLIALNVVALLYLAALSKWTHKLRSDLVTLHDSIVRKLGGD